jgi:hypothetical protein
VAGGVNIDGVQLQTLKSDVASLAVSIDQIAHGAYVTKTMFTTTQASSATAMDDLLHVLVSAADTMQSCAQNLVTYLDKVFIEYEALDLSLAVHVNRPQQ